MTTDPTPDTEPAEPAPVNLGMHLGLGPAWAISPAAWELQPLAAADGTQAYALILRTAGGSMGAAMTADNVRELVRQCEALLAAAPGIVVPPKGLVLPANGNRAQRRHPGRQ